MQRRYPTIDIKRTGRHLKQKINSAGYSVREMQEYLHLSCPQPIYRWFQGKGLPSVDHLYALSRLLHVPMEQLLVSEERIDKIQKGIGRHSRLMTYWQLILD